MGLITKGMGAIIKGRKKPSISQKDKVSAAKDKAIGKIKSAKRKAYKKKFGKEPTVIIRSPGGKKETIINQMIGDKEIDRYNKIINAKTWRKR